MQHEIPAEIVQLVHHLLDAGCDMWAIRKGYVMNEPSQEPHASIVQRLLDEFGPRSHVREHIAAYLTQLGRNLDEELL